MRITAHDETVKGKRPGVLVLYEWCGRNDHARPRQPADLGYIALVPFR